MKGTFVVATLVVCACGMPPVLADHLHHPVGLDEEVVADVGVVRAPQPVAPADTNSCIEGSVIGGLLGAGLGAMLSRGNGRWIGVPLGGAAGVLLGCQVDGG